MSVWKCDIVCSVYINLFLVGESLLAARVEVDSVHVVKRIVALLIDSFQPGNVSPSQQVCVHVYISECIRTFSNRCSINLAF